MYIVILPQQDGGVGHWTMMTEIAVVVETLSDVRCWSSAIHLLSSKSLLH